MKTITILFLFLGLMSNSLLATDLDVVTMKSIEKTESDKGFDTARFLSNVATVRCACSNLLWLYKLDYPNDKLIELLIKQNVSDISLALLVLGYQIEAHDKEPVQLTKYQEAILSIKAKSNMRLFSDVKQSYWKKLKGKSDSTKKKQSSALDTMIKYGNPYRFKK